MPGSSHFVTCEPRVGLQPWRLLDTPFVRVAAQKGLLGFKEGAWVRWVRGNEQPASEWGLGLG